MFAHAAAEAPARRQAPKWTVTAARSPAAGPSLPVIADRVSASGAGPAGAQKGSNAAFESRLEDCTERLEIRAHALRFRSSSALSPL